LSPEAPHEQRLRLLAASAVAILMVPIERAELVELLGNVLDNASREAHCEVYISMLDGNGDAVLVIEDDGPGVEASNIAKIMARGFSLGENAQGTGLGLAIVKEIAEIYGLQVEFASSSLGGLSVKIRFSSRDT
jgi:signal transduction histidine kinase